MEYGEKIRRQGGKIGNKGGCVICKRKRGPHKASNGSHSHIFATLITSSRTRIVSDGMAGNRASLVRKCVALACIAAAIWMASGVRILWRDLSCAAASAIGAEISEVITLDQRPGSGLEISVFPLVSSSINTAQARDHPSLRSRKSRHLRRAFFRGPFSEPASPSTPASRNQPPGVRPKRS